MSPAADIAGPNLRIWNFQGLRVRDSSVMPHMPSRNTDAPTVVADEKGADIIGEREPLPAARLRPGTQPPAAARGAGHQVGS
ncbi:MAG: hypothetical protein KDJ87_03885 [Rhizobiaceae bacterium]|nr:hypothetical protein [Rhizobiaceae bacterium]